MALKVSLIVYAAIHILLGLALILSPNQIAALLGFGEINAASMYLAALCGVMFIAVSVFWIIAAKDPLKHLIWVRFAILWTSLGVIVQLYLLVQGVVDFRQAGLGIVQDAVFAVIFLAFYPYHDASIK